MQGQRIGEAAAWMAGWLLATLGMTLAGRELGKAMSVYQIMMLRSLIAVAILTPIVMLNGGLAGRLSQFRLHVVRNVIHYGGQFAWFTALLLIPLAEAIAIEFTLPLWVAILAVFFLGERMTAAKALALMLGFGGVLMIVRPGLSLQAGHLVSLAGALLFACSVTLTKLITRKDSALTVIFLMFAIQSVMGAVPAWLTWVTPPIESYLWIAVVGLAGTGSHYCLSKAIALADATIVMPMDFLRLPLTAVLGFLLYQEGIDALFVIGAGLILAANAINLFKARSG